MVMTQHDIKYLSSKEFRDLGLLQEINRQFLHPIGLALEARMDSDELRIQDHRYDPEGMIFAQGVLSEDKQRRVADLQKERAIRRRKLLGYVVQPIIHIEIGRRVQMKEDAVGIDDLNMPYALNAGDWGTIHTVSSLDRYTINWDRGQFTTWPIQEVIDKIEFLEIRA